jgi:hypothetical protein
MPPRSACSSKPSAGAPPWLQKQYRRSPVRRSLASPHSQSWVLHRWACDTAQRRTALVLVRRDLQCLQPEPVGSLRVSNPGRGSQSPPVPTFRQLAREEFPPLTRPRAAGPAGSHQRPELTCYVAPCSGSALRADRQRRHQYCTARLHAALLCRLDDRPAVPHSCPVQLKCVGCR